MYAISTLYQHLRDICIGNSVIVVIFGINTTSDISKLLL